MYLQKVTSRKSCVKKLVFCWHLEGQWRKKQNPDPGSGSISQRHGSADPDPHQNVMDTEHCLQQPKYSMVPGMVRLQICVRHRSFSYSIVNASSMTIYKNMFEKILYKCRRGKNLSCSKKKIQFFLSPWNSLFTNIVVSAPGELYSELNNAKVSNP